MKTKLALTALGLAVALTGCKSIGPRTIPLASPPDKTSAHIQALAHISGLMNLEEFRHQVYSAETAQQIYDLFKSHEK